MADLKTKLLPDLKRQTFANLYQQCENRVKRIKLRNDHLQKNAGTDMQQQIAEEVTRQKESLESDITQLRNIIREMEGRFRDQESKNKLKKVKKDAQTQFERNKAIMTDFITKSFIKVEEHLEEMRNSMKGSMRGSTHEASPPINTSQVTLKQQQQTPKKPSPIFQPYQKESIKSNTDKNGESFLSQQQQLKESQLEIDYDIHMKLEMDKAELLMKVAQDAVNINEIMQDITQMIDKQGEDLDIMDKNIHDAHQNAVDANNEMENANQLQKKARKRTIYLVFIIFIIVVLVGGLVYFLAF